MVENMNTTKLEQAVKELDEKYASNPAFKKPSITDIALKTVVDMQFNILKAQSDLAQRHIIALRSLERQSGNLHDASIILGGKNGFLRCSQGWAGLQSGWTAFEEIASRLTEPMVDVSLERMNVPFGMELWSIDDRGMMTLIDANRDSSD